MLVIIFADVSHVEVAIERSYRWKLGFLEWSPGQHILIWIDSFSGKQILL